MEENIHLIEEMIKNVETYTLKGVWNPHINKQIALEIHKADVELNQLMTGHTMKIDILSGDQVAQVSNLLKRLNQSKGNLPSPPWNQFKM